MVYAYLHACMCEWPMARVKSENSFKSSLFPSTKRAAVKVGSRGFEAALSPLSQRTGLSLPLCPSPSHLPLGLSLNVHLQSEMTVHALNSSNADPGNARGSAGGIHQCVPRPVGKLCFQLMSQCLNPSLGHLPNYYFTCLGSISHQKNWDTIISQIYFVDFRICSLFVCFMGRGCGVVLETRYCFASILLAVFGLVWFYFQCPIYSVNVDYGGVFTFKVTAAQEKARKTYHIE